MRLASLPKTDRSARTATGPGPGPGLQEQLNQAHQAQVQLQPILQLLRGGVTSLAPEIVPPTAPPTPLATDQGGATKSAIADDGKKTGKRKILSAEVLAKVNAVIDAIIDYNNSPGRSHGEKWGISFPVVKALGTPIRASYQKAIKQVFEDRQADIDAHHQLHGLGSRHNRGKKFEQLTQIIQVQRDWERSA